MMRIEKELTKGWQNSIESSNFMRAMQAWHEQHEDVEGPVTKDEFFDYLWEIRSNAANQWPKPTAGSSESIFLLGEKEPKKEPKQPKKEEPRKEEPPKEQPQQQGGGGGGGSGGGGGGEGGDGKKGKKKKKDGGAAGRAEGR